ncbi:hypothetical protein [Micrococcus luteus]|uniref:hypothetical protein n=1 Tax=Micrococcus luteus TaxID=1270 RepID=UPI0011C03FF6|nr:hypothetical protein [Micrococcus luteus]
MAQDHGTARRGGAEGRTGPSPSPAVRIALWAPAGWVVLLAALVIAGPVLPVPTAVVLAAWTVSLVLPLAALPTLWPRPGAARRPGPVVAYAVLAVLRCVLFAWDRSVDAFYPAAPLDVGLCLGMVLAARRLPRG